MIILPLLLPLFFAIGVWFYPPVVISYTFLFSNTSVSFLNLFLFFVILLFYFLSFLSFFLSFLFFFFFGAILWVLGPWFRGQRAGLTENIRPQGILIRVQYPRSPYVKTKTQLYPTACKLHCWKLQAEQLVKEEHSSTHHKNLQDQIKEEEIGSHQLQIGTGQGHLPSASAGIESCAAAAVNLWHALKEVHSGEWSTLCGRETGRTGL